DTLLPYTTLFRSAISSDETVVPAANIVFGGTGANRTATITPASNAYGSSTITITVHDTDGGAASDSFALVVTPVNDAPTISAIADQTTPEDTTLGPIAFTVGDVETA